MVQPYPLRPLKHPLPGTADTLEGGERSKTKAEKGPREDPMFSLETQKESNPGWIPPGLLWRRACCEIQQGRPTISE